MTFQDAFNIAIGLIGTLLGWLLRVLWSSMHDLRQADASLVERVQKVEVLVAGQYVKRDDLDRSLGDIFRKLERIEEKLDNKADK